MVARCPERDLDPVDADELLASGDLARWAPPVEPPDPVAAPEVFGELDVPVERLREAFRFEWLHPSVIRVPNAIVLAGESKGTTQTPTGHLVVDGGHAVLTEDRALLTSSLWRGTYLPTRYVDIAESEPQLRRRYRPPTKLDGAYLFLGRNFNGFGHTLVDSLSRLWSIAELPNVRELQIAYCGEPLGGFMGRCVDALGLSRSQFVHLDQPTSVESLLVPSPGFVVRTGAASAYNGLLVELGKALLGDEPEGTVERVFLSRSRFTRRGRSVRPMGEGQEARLDAMAAERSFEIVHPQELPIARQVALVSGAKVVAGCTGSANHLFAFRPSACPHLILSPQHVINWNDHAFHSLKGSRNTYWFSGQVAGLRQGLSAFERKQLEWSIDEDQFAAYLDDWLQP